MKKQYIEWILRIGVAGEFIGHGMLALQGKQQWVGWVHQMTGFDTLAATHFLFIIGLSDLLVAFIMLVKPIRPVLLWAAFWGFWTALLRPLVGESVLDFVERSANWAAPLALYFLLKKQKKESQ